MSINELTKLKVVKKDAGLIFSGQASNNLVKAYDQSCVFTPQVDQNYVFHESSRDVIVWFMHPSDPIYCFGPTGSGKSSLIRQVASKLNFPVFEITGHSRLEFPDMVGHLSVKKGNMEFEYGPLALAMKYGGVFLLNEIDLLDPSTAAGLNTILDGSPLCIPENNGELIKPHLMFRFAATANTNGGSDHSGLYQGTLKQNLAFMDRFSMCEVPYPEERVEESLLQKAHPSLPEALSKKMVTYANSVRKLFMGEIDDSMKLSDRIEVTFSTRTLLRWGELTLRFKPLSAQGIQPLLYALDRSLGFRASADSRALLHELAQRTFSDETLKTL